jgi:hypothetical protein
VISNETRDRVMGVLKQFLIIVVMSVASVNAAVAAGYGDFTEGMEKKEGLATLYLDHAKAKVFLELDGKVSGEVGRYIYAAYLTAGLGSNPLGLDRSVPRGGKMLEFRRVGSQVMAVVENMRFRASADNPTEKKAVRTSFAESIIWSTKVAAEDAEAGKILIDLTGFLARDAVGVSSRIQSRGQGSFSLDSKRSYVETAEAHSFPINMEFDARLTFKSSKPGSEIRATTPVPEAVTLVAHTTLMKLPDPGYEIRQGDERAGILSDAHIDMSAPLTGDTVVRLAERFRLQKDADGKVINPIVFYIDNGAPEPIRGALLEGANWWATAFEKAGFPGGYRAEILPEGVHPLDARYNVVNWVHRATRGWSYGAAITDPRTGEILRGVVLLGSLRVRQDIKIFEALAGTSKTGTGVADDPVELALARIRQLSAHEIGHSIGFAHNMAASTYGDRASVMDYPAPDVRMKDGAFDFSRTYGVGVGAWDDWTVNFLYSDYGSNDAETQASLIKEADAAGLLYVSDGDSRSVGSGHAKGALWDTGEDAVASLQNAMAVRRAGLDNFGARNLRAGESFRVLQTKFVPLYLYHRYQLQAAAKYVGGFDYTYRHQGDNRSAPAFVDPAKQEEALDALLGTLSPAVLDVSDALLADLSPLGYADGDPQFSRETFAGNGRPMFDHMGAVAVAADLSLDALLHPRRLLRLYEQGMRSDSHASLDETLAKIVSSQVRIPRSESDRHTELRKIVVARLTEALIELNQGTDTALPVRAETVSALANVRALLGRYDDEDKAFAKALRLRIDTAAARARTPAVKEPSGPAVPPGSPIGAGAAESCWHCDSF